MRTQWARFQPKRLDTLRPRAAAQVGQVFEWMEAWTITEDDGGPYVGQTAWTICDYDYWFGWVPDEDLEPVEASEDVVHAAEVVLVEL